MLVPGGPKSCRRSATRITRMAGNQAIPGHVALCSMSALVPAAGTHQERIVEIAGHQRGVNRHATEPAPYAEGQASAAAGAVVAGSDGHAARKHPLDADSERLHA